MAGGGNETTLEYTPTWVVAAVCSLIVFISLVIEKILHFTGKRLKKKNKKTLFQALQKVKEELMVLGFISLLLAVFQSRIGKFCISPEAYKHWLPCEKNDEKHKKQHHFSDYCSHKGKVPLMTITALHHLHIFVFVLAIVHVIICVLTVVFGMAKIRQWKQWEDSALEKEYDPGQVQFTDVRDHDFIKNRFRGLGRMSTLLGWLHSFFKQFYASVTKSDYLTLRQGFIMAHCRGNPKFNFHNYTIRSLEADFRKVVGISFFLWIFVVVFLMLNVYGFHAYFWLAFIPFVLLLAVGTKLEHIITQLAHDIAEKHVAMEGDLVVQPSDDHFWFHRPKIVLVLIHIILFQNSFEFAVFFWILFQYGFDSCIMGEFHFIIPRLVLGVFVQFLCSYSTLPLYAIVSQMGSSFKKAIFEEHIQEGLLGWARHAKRKEGLRKAGNGASDVGPRESPPVSIQLAKAGENETVSHQPGEIQPATTSTRPKWKTSESETHPILH